jgi:hypothetical protein
MSEHLDQATQYHQVANQEALNIVLQLTEKARIQSITKPLPKGGGFAAFADDNLSAFACDLKPPYFVAVLWHTGDKFLPDFEDGRSLKNCLAWILRYDSHHAKWSVEAWNKQQGNRSFSRLARRLTTE